VPLLGAFVLGNPLQPRANLMRHAGDLGAAGQLETLFQRLPMVVLLQTPRST
jgi:hypothetical protein